VRRRSPSTTSEHAEHEGRERVVFRERESATVALSAEGTAASLDGSRVLRMMTRAAEGNTASEHC
jgi:hypothetical protein